MKKLFICAGFIGVCFYSLAQNDSLQTAPAIINDTTTHVSAEHPATDISGEPVYQLKPAVDIPVTAVAAAWSGFAFTKIYSKDGSTPEQIQSLRISNINGFDRWAADVHSESAANTSDFIFYGSMPLPALLFLDKKISKDAGKVGFLYLEAMSITGLLYTGSTYLTDRYRPYAYNPNVPMGDRLEGGAKNSFFAGHVALVGTSTFFMAKVYSDYHPESKLKWLFYGGATLATGATAYLRHKGGRHFPSDIVLGTAVGVLSGVLVPHFHKNKIFKNPRLSVSPFIGQTNGLSVVYRL